MSAGTHPSVLKRLQNWPFANVPTKLLLADGKMSGGVLKDFDFKAYVVLTLWGQRDGRIWANQTSLAAAMNVDRTTIWRCLDRLERANALIRASNGDIILVGWGDYVPPDAANLQHETLQICNEDVANSQHISRRTKEKKEVSDSASPTASALVVLNSPSEPEEAKEVEKKEEKAKERATRSAAPSPGGTNEPHRHIDPMVEGEKPNGRGRNTGTSAKKPAPRNPAIDELIVVWATEVKDRWPDYVVPTSTHKQIGQARHLFNQFGAENAAKIIRVAVWDWLAIQEVVEVWKTKDTPVPDIGDILYLGTKLAAFVSRGVISPRRRVSEYHKRFVAKPIAPEKKKAQDDKYGGLSPAAYYQNLEYDKKQKKEAVLALEKKRLQEVEAQREANRNPDGSYR